MPISPPPVYRQIYALIADWLIDGAYGDDDQLPSVRALAAQCGANPLTVAKAYHQLQEQGIVVARRGVGLFVAPGAPDRLRAQLRVEFLTDQWPLVAAQARRLGIDLDQLVARPCAPVP